MSSSEKDLREHYLALHFVAFGHVLHLLQDMASVAHTRNDFIADHVRADLLPFDEGESLESAGDRQEVFANVMRTTAGRGLQSVPKLHLALSGVGHGNLADYLDAQVPLEPKDFDVADYWDRAPFDAPDDTDPARAGLAERVHNRFFSAGSIHNSALQNGYGLPRVPACDPAGASAGSGDDRTWIANLPARKLATGERLGDATTPDTPFVSSPLVPHLARCRLHEVIAVSKAGGAASGVQHRWRATVVDESVQRDYLELLFPLVIDYTAKFMESYFQPRIEVVPTSEDDREQTFKLRNLTPHPIRASEKAVEIVYDVAGDDPYAIRQRVPVNCGTSEIVLPPRSSPGEVAPLGDAVLIDAATGNATYYFDLREGTFRIAACDENGCGPWDEEIQFWLSFSGDGTRGALTSHSEQGVKFYTAEVSGGDLEGTPITALRRANKEPLLLSDAGCPTLSPDGTSTAFVAASDLWALPTAGGADPLQVTANGAAIKNRAWLSLLTPR